MAVVRRAKGNLRFPLDKTYHGCPRNTPEKTLHEIKAVVIAGKNIPFLNAPYNYMLEQVRYVDSSGSWQDRKTADALELVKFLRTSPTDLKNVPYGPYKDKRQGQLNKVSPEYKSFVDRSTCTNLMLQVASFEP